MKCIRFASAKERSWGLWRLVQAFQQVIGNGLRLLAIEVLEEM